MKASGIKLRKYPWLEWLLQLAHSCQSSMVLLDSFTKASGINTKAMPKFEVIIAIRVVHVNISWFY